jgi:hypothetical protein
LVLEEEEEEENKVVFQVKVVFLPVVLPVPPVKEAEKKFKLQVLVQTNNFLLLKLTLCGNTRIKVVTSTLDLISCPN